MAAMCALPPTRVRPVLAWRSAILSRLTLPTSRSNRKLRDFSAFHSTNATKREIAAQNNASKYYVSEPLTNVNSSSGEDTGASDARDVGLLQFIKSLKEKLSARKTTIQRGWTRLTARRGVGAAFNQDSFPPQVLGLTARLLRERLDFLEEIGITGKDALIIATDFPAVLSWSCPTFNCMLEVLVQDLDCNVVKLMSKTPYVFAFNVEQAKNNINKLEGAGISKKVIGQLVDHNPLVLAYSFREDSLETIQYLFSDHEELGGLKIGRTQTSASELLPQLLIQPFERPGEQVEMNENSREVISFLKELQVPPWIIAASNPNFFNTDVEKLYGVVEFLMGRPLFLETSLIQRLLIQRSEIFVNVDILTLKRRILLAHDILRSPSKLYMLLQTCFFFEGGVVKLEESIEMLREYGFGDKHISQLITFKDFFSLEGNNLKENIDFLLSVEGVTVEQIGEYPLCLLKPLPFIQERMKFLAAVNPRGLQQVDFEQIFVAGHKEFVTNICNSDTEKYKEVMKAS